MRSNIYKDLRERHALIVWTATKDILSKLSWNITATILALAVLFIFVIPFVAFLVTKTA